MSIKETKNTKTVMRSSFCYCYSSEPHNHTKLRHYLVSIPSEQHSLSAKLNNVLDEEESLQGQSKHSEVLFHNYALVDKSLKLLENGKPFSNFIELDVNDINGDEGRRRRRSRRHYDVTRRISKNKLIE